MIREEPFAHVDDTSLIFQCQRWLRNGVVHDEAIRWLGEVQRRETAQAWRVPALLEDGSDLRREVADVLRAARAWENGGA